MSFLQLPYGLILSDSVSHFSRWSRPELGKGTLPLHCSKDIWYLPAPVSQSKICLLLEERGPSTKLPAFLYPGRVGKQRGTCCSYHLQAEFSRCSWGSMAHTRDRKLGGKDSSWLRGEAHNWSGNRCWEHIHLWQLETEKERHISIAEKLPRL